MVNKFTVDLCCSSEKKICKQVISLCIKIWLLFSLIAGVFLGANIAVWLFVCGLLVLSIIRSGIQIYLNIKDPKICYHSRHKNEEE
jgi:hypothetical protein